MKRKIAAALFAGGAVFLVCGCGRKAAEADTDTTVSAHIEINLVQDTEPSGEEAESQPESSLSDNSTASTAEETEDGTETETENISGGVSAWYGTWKIRDYQTADVYAMSQEEIMQYLGGTISYDRDSLTVNGQKTDEVQFEYDAEPYTEASIAEAFRANLGEWWNGIGEVTGIHVIAQENPFGSFFFAVNEDVLWIYQDGVFFLAGRQPEAGGIAAGFYEGQYMDYDTNEPGLEIQKSGDGTYAIQISVFRLAYMDDGIGRVTDRGLEFSATAPNGKEITGTITVEGDIAAVIFDSLGWSSYSDVNEYRYYRASDTP